jgi:hypothetical protein
MIAIMDYPAKHEAKRAGIEPTVLIFCPERKASIASSPQKFPFWGISIFGICSIPRRVHPGFCLQ